MSLLQEYGRAATQAVSFFWKAGWAFVLGYWVSAMIQAFVPKGRLTPYMGDASPRSISIASVFGAASSSCSFAALAAARSLVMKGAHFVAAIAFMFASTNLVIELGILILIFLGWQFLAAEIVGGVLLIGISSVLVKLTYPKAWLDDARKALEEGAGAEADDFDWRKRIRTSEGWNLVGNRFVADWKMVWEEIVIGFTIAGFVAVLVPASAWDAIFLAGMQGTIPGWMITLENVAVAPFVAAATFIGSMGNIPLATVLNANGVMFAGVMGFIYSDLMVPPLVMINAKYYGWRVALYIAGIMFISIVCTALLLHYAFALLGLTPESGRRITDVAQFQIDYTFFFNIAFAGVAGALVWLNRRHQSAQEGGHDHGGGGLTVKRGAAFVAIGVIVGGLVARLMTA